MKRKALVLAVLLACASVPAQASADRVTPSASGKYRDLAACALSVLVGTIPSAQHLSMLACARALVHWIV